LDASREEFTEKMRNISDDVHLYRAAAEAVDDYAQGELDKTMHYLNETKELSREAEQLGQKALGMVQANKKMLQDMQAQQLQVCGFFLASPSAWNCMMLEIQNHPTHPLPIARVALSAIILVCMVLLGVPLLITVVRRMNTVINCCENRCTACSGCIRRMAMVVFNSVYTAISPFIIYALVASHGQQGCQSADVKRFSLVVPYDTSSHVLSTGPHHFLFVLPLVLIVPCLLFGCQLKRVLCKRSAHAGKNPRQKKCTDVSSRLYSFCLVLLPLFPVVVLVILLGRPQQWDGVWCVMSRVGVLVAMLSCSALLMVIGTTCMLRGESSDTDEVE